MEVGVWVGITCVEVAEGGMDVKVGVSAIKVGDAVGIAGGVDERVQAVRKLNVSNKMETGFIKKRVIWNPPAHCTRRV